MLMLGCGVNQEVLATEETPQALPQASFNSQEYIAYCRQQQQAFSSLVFPAQYSADVPLICFYTTHKKILIYFCSHSWSLFAACCIK